MLFGNGVVNLDFFIGGFARQALAKPNREFFTKNGPIRRAQVSRDRPLPRWPDDQVACRYRRHQLAHPDPSDARTMECSPASEALLTGLKGVGHVIADAAYDADPLTACAQTTRYLASHDKVADPNTGAERLAQNLQLLCVRSPPFDQSYECSYDWS